MARQGTGFGSVGPEAWRILRPKAQMIIDGDRELPTAHLAAVEAIDIDSSFDGAAILKVHVRCSDSPEGKVLFRDEPWLQFPQVVDLWAGYGTIDQPLGRFYMKRGEFQHGPNGISGTLIGYDALERLMHHKAPRLFKGYERTSDVAREVIDDYGLASEIDESAPLKALRKVVKRGGRTVSVPPDHHKPAGDTDLRWLKMLAAGNDYLYPYVRLVGDQTSAQEVLYFVRPGWDRQKEEGDVVELRYAFPGGDNTIESFNPAWSVAGLPTAVRVTMLVDGQWVSVQRELVEESGEVWSEGTQISSSPTAPKFRSDLAQWDTSRGPDPRAAYVEVLASGAVKDVPGPKRKRGTKDPKLQTWSRDTVIAFKMEPGGMGPLELADAWLLSRSKLGIAGPLRLSGVVGAHRILANSIQPVLGVGRRDSGWYMVHRASHRFSGGTHDVTLALERQAGKLEAA